MTASQRTIDIGIIVYALLYLGLIGFSFAYLWIGDTEMVIAVAALVPAVLHFCGFRRARYLVGVIAALSALLGLAMPIASMDRGRYFWPIWTPIWLLLVFSAVVSFLPARQPAASAD